jgi:hypothetical protein
MGLALLAHDTMEMGLALIAHASMPLKYWDEASLVVTYLINHTPTKLLSYDTPLHKLFGVIPDYSSFRVFGCVCWPNLRLYNSHKLQLCSTQCVFLKYSNMHKGFKCLDVFKGRIYISQDVIFMSLSFPSNPSTLMPTSAITPMAFSFHCLLQGIILLLTRLMILLCLCCLFFNLLCSYRRWPLKPWYKQIRLFPRTHCCHH